MAENDDRDPDREAIMARRRRFIAVALGSLTGCAPGKPGPTPTSTNTSTSGPTTGVESSESGPDGGSESESGTDSAPQPCLKFDLPPASESESDSGTETGTPRPCLVPPGVLP